MIADDERAVFLTNALRVDDDDPDDDDDLEDEDDEDDEDDDEEGDEDEPETWQVSPENRFALKGAFCLTSGIELPRLAGIFQLF